MLTFKFKSVLLGGAYVACFAAPATAENFNIPGGDLENALNTYVTQTGVHLIVSEDAIKGIQSRGVKGDLPTDQALSRILAGSGFTVRNEAGVLAVVRSGLSSDASDVVQLQPMQLAQAAPPRTAVETVTVTSSKLGGADVQSIPIAITALSQEQLTSTQTAGGPDLVKQVPNLTFTKTNFSGYSIQLRGIGTQAISVTTDPAVAVALNDIPFIRNHFFEQEFYDVGQVEVLRGPQGTLYGRNATAGVVNVVSAKPTDTYEAMGSIDVGNYNNRRMEGMLNVPIIGDKLDLRVAGEWTKRDGYSYDEATEKPIDGRDLWSGRVSVLFQPIERLTATAVWEHFQEDDDRERSSKQLCTRADPPAVVDGPAGPQVPTVDTGSIYLTQGCKAGSLYAPAAFGTPSAGAVPFIGALASVGYLFGGDYVDEGVDPYKGLVQSHNLRVIDSELMPTYKAKNDTLEFNADFQVTDALTLSSQTGYSKDHLRSTQDYNRFNSAAGIFRDVVQNGTTSTGGTLVGMDGEFCDPQLGCSTKLVGEDLSEEDAQQFSQELRLASHFSGPLNFSIGGNFLHYQTLENYYVLYNAITLLQEGVNSYFGPLGEGNGEIPADAPHIPFDAALANSCNPQPADPNNLPLLGLGCGYIDPNPISKLDGQGHNYFRSQNPYRLNSWAGFGEIYYQVTPDIKLTGGIRYTDDRKEFSEIPSWTDIIGKGYPTFDFVDPAGDGIIRQQWKEVTGRFNAAWTPKLDFTDQTLLYASYSRGYKGGGANPPGVTPICFLGTVCYGSPSNLTHPLTFAPEFVNAFELGTKNALLDGALTVDADVFYYGYKNYQISEILDRAAVNFNFDAKVKGAEFEASWEPLPGLRFNAAAGYEDATLDKGQQAIDLMDRTDGNPNWMVVRPYVTQTSNCILPTYVVNELIVPMSENTVHSNIMAEGCLTAYGSGSNYFLDPVTLQPYLANPDPINLPGYPGFNPATAPNNGAGFAKDVGGNKLPNTPPFTLSAGAQYSMPISENWGGTLRGDFYWQGNSFARVFNDKPYDQLHGYTNVNLNLIFTNQDGWQAMVYVKNVFDTTAITGAFLNSDDSALTTNVFLTDPRLFGIRITKNW